MPNYSIDGVNVSQIKYMHRILKHSDQIFTFYKTRLKAGIFFNHVNTNFKNKYSINACRTPLDVAIARINWVQTHEPRSKFCRFYNM